MMNRNQQSLNMNQHLLNDRANNNHQNTGEETQIADTRMIYKDQWDFLGKYGTLFRKSSLVLIVTLGRQYTTRFHVRDLSRLLQYDVSLISKNLKKLESLGVVKHEDVGNLVFYQANMTSMLLKQMKICFTLLELNDLIYDIDPISSNSILYGSCAKGEDTVSSDIDLFIQTIEKDTVREVLNNYQKRIARTLSPVIATPDEMYKMKMTDKNFFSSINQGIILKEGENVF
jgi:hypothetical protein